LVENVGRQIVAETNNADLGEFISEVYHKGHENFYENQRSEVTLWEVIHQAELALPVLESLYQATPLPFTIESNNQLRRLIALTGNNDLQIGDSSSIESNNQLRRLIALTGNNDLQIGDSSSAGFSLKHAAGGDR
jgi:hypothetical protein